MSELPKIKMRLIDRIRMWVWGQKKEPCDGCSGVFRRRHLDPTSGDVWLCPNCMDALLEDMRQQHVEFLAIEKPDQKRR